MTIFFRSVVVPLALFLLVLQPKSTQASQLSPVNRANNFLSDGRFKKAETEYRKLIATDNSGSSHVGLVYSLVSQKDEKKFSEAFPVLKEAELKFSKSPCLLAAAGYVTFKYAQSLPDSNVHDRHLDAAEVLCQSALEKNKSLIQPYLTLSLVYSDRGNEEQSVFFLNQAFVQAGLISRTKSNLSTTNERIDRCFRKGKRAIAQRDFELVESEFKKALVTKKFDTREFYPHMQSPSIDKKL